MRRKPGTPKPTADRVVRDIRRKTRKRHSVEEKIKVAIEKPTFCREGLLSARKPTFTRRWASVRFVPTADIGRGAGVR